MSLPPFPEGRDVAHAAIGDLPQTEILLEADIVLSWVTTLPSGHRAFVFWSDCADDRNHDRYHVYTFQDTRFDAAYKKIMGGEFVRPVLETCDWVYVVDWHNDNFHRARVVAWADLDQSAIPTNEARIQQEVNDATQAPASQPEDGSVDSQ